MAKMRCFCMMCGLIQSVKNDFCEKCGTAQITMFDDETDKIQWDGHNSGKVTVVDKSSGKIIGRTGIFDGRDLGYDKSVKCDKKEYSVEDYYEIVYDNWRDWNQDVDLNEVITDAMYEEDLKSMMSEDLSNEDIIDRLDEYVEDYLDNHCFN